MTARKSTEATRRASRVPRRPAPKVSTESNGTVTWVYGVLAGAVSDGVIARLPRLPDGGAPYAIPLGDGLSIIVAQVPREPFEAGTLETQLRNIDWVGRYASAHHAAIARLAQRGTVLPLRIFSVFESDERAKQAIGRGRKRLASLASRIGTRSEWVLRVHRPTPSTPKSAPPSGSTASGTAFLQARARAQRERVARAQRIDAGVAALIDELTLLADDVVERAVEPGTSALAEAAFLIGNGDVAGFKRALTKSSVELRREGCRIALTGPWPVYSFVKMPGTGRD